MTKKTISWIVGAIVIIAIIVTVILVGGPGRLFQGALYNLRPIYTSCHIEGQNYNSDNLDDCEHFNDKFIAHAFPNGEMTIFAKYADKKLAENIIPVKVEDNKLSCNYLSNGYVPKVRTFDPVNPITSADIDSDASVPLGSNGLVVELNYQKNNQTYFYDTNICESAFLGTLKGLGTAKLDYNSFINSRPLVNQILISDNPYYQNSNGESIKTLQPGNPTLSINPAPDITFKLTIACSNFIPQVKIPNIETTKTGLVSIQGITQDYFDICGSHLYVSLQNTNRYDDIQVFNNIKWDYTDGTLSFQLDPEDIARVTDINTVFPISFKLSLHLRDRSDSKDVFTLGTSIYTVPNHKIAANDTAIPTTEITTDTINDNSASPNVTIVPSDTETPTPATEALIMDSESGQELPPANTDLSPSSTDATMATEIDPAPSKVRRSPERILTNPIIPGQNDLVEQNAADSSAASAPSDSTVKVQ